MIGKKFLEKHNNFDGLLTSCSLTEVIKEATFEKKYFKMQDMKISVFPISAFTLRYICRYVFRNECSSFEYSFFTCWMHVYLSVVHFKTISILSIPGSLCYSHGKFFFLPLKQGVRILPIYRWGELFSSKFESLTQTDWLTDWLKKKKKKASSVRKGKEAYVNTERSNLPLFHSFDLWAYTTKPIPTIGRSFSLAIDWESVWLNE